MKRKYIINLLRIVIVILILNYNNYSYGFLWDNLWLDLYTKIDNWIPYMENKNYDRLMWWESGKKYEEINRILKADWIWECLNSELTTSEIKEVAKWNYWPLKWKIDKKCLDKDENITNIKLNQIQYKIKEIDIKYSKSAETETKEIFQISGIWIYSDWDINNSWFDLISDLEEINKIIFSEELKYVWEDISSQDDSFNNFSTSKPNNNRNLSSWYSSVNDNSSWPCDDILCIEMGFKTYNWWFWGSSDSSIQWLVEKSNEHLKKFAWSFMWQSNMTSWLFECSICKNIDFGEMFHVWFQIISKPVPILKVNKKESEWSWWTDDESLTALNMLYETYKIYWLDYKRANDLTIYRSELEKRKWLLDSVELNPKDLVKKEVERNIYKNKSNENFLWTSVNKKVLASDTNDFYKYFLEVERNTKAILNYTESLRWIIAEMKKTPVKP